MSELTQQLDARRRDLPNDLQSTRNERAAIDKQIESEGRTPTALSEFLPVVFERVDQSSEESLRQLLELGAYTPGDAQLHLQSFTHEQLFRVSVLGQREAIKEGIEKALTSRWPTDAKTTREKLERIAALKEQRAEIEKRERALLQEARSLGVELGSRVSRER